MVELTTLLRTADGSLVTLEEEVVPKPNRWGFIEGAIVMNINEVCILDENEWDYVSYIWISLAEMASELRSSGFTESFFPDQPLRISFKRIDPGYVLVQLSEGQEKPHKSARVNEYELLEALRDAGIRFFRKMQDIVTEPSGSYTKAIQELKSIR